MVVGTHVTGTVHIVNVVLHVHVYCTCNVTCLSFSCQIFISVYSLSLSLSLSTHSARLYSDREQESGFYTGRIEAVDIDSHKYWVTFDRPGLGKHPVADTEIRVNKCAHVHVHLHCSDIHLYMCMYMYM